MSPVGWGQIHTLEFCLGTLTALQESHTPARSLPARVCAPGITAFNSKENNTFSSIHNRDLLLSNSMLSVGLETMLFTLVELNQNPGATVLGCAVIFRALYKKQASASFFREGAYK